MKPSLSPMIAHCQETVWNPNGYPKLSTNASLYQIYYIAFLVLEIAVCYAFAILLIQTVVNFVCTANLGNV